VNSVINRFSEVSVNSTGFYIIVVISALPLQYTVCCVFFYLNTFVLFENVDVSADDYVICHHRTCNLVQITIITSARCV